MAPAAATILENPDLFAIQRWVGVDNVFVKELSIDLPCAIASLKSEGAGTCLGDRRLNPSLTLFPPFTVTNLRKPQENRQ
jgi:hypothetical protein